MNILIFLLFLVVILGVSLIFKGRRSEGLNKMGLLYVILGIILIVFAIYFMIYVKKIVYL